jgi:hypothetical protein
VIQFCGESFAIAERIGLMPLMKFARVARTGADSADLESLAVMLDLLEQCIAPKDWQRFQDVADRERADGDQLFAVVKDVFEVLSERPTSRPSDSSDGPTSTGPSSTDEVSSVLELFKGRPDLGAAVVRAQASATA